MQRTRSLRPGPPRHRRDRPRLRPGRDTVPPDGGRISLPLRSGRGQAGTASFEQRNSVPSIQTRCRTTANLRASATRAAFLLPIRRASRVPQAFRADHRATRARKEHAGGFEQVGSRPERVAELRHFTVPIDLAGLVTTWRQAEVGAHAGGAPETCRVVDGGDEADGGQLAPSPAESRRPPRASFLEPVLDRLQAQPPRAGHRRQHVAAPVPLEQAPPAVVRAAVDAVAGDPSTLADPSPQERLPAAAEGRRGRPPPAPAAAWPSRAWAWSRTRPPRAHRPWRVARDRRPGARAHRARGRSRQAPSFAPASAQNTPT